MEVLIVDDHPVLREILQAVTRKALKDARVAAVSDLESAFESAGRGSGPELVLLDLGLPGHTGLEALTRFRKKFPRLRLVVVSATEDRKSIVAALGAGAAGYIPKTSTRDVMIAALRLVAAGGTYVPPEALADEPAHAARHARRSRGVPAELSERQVEVLGLLIRGYTNRRIASELEITESTVKQHAHEIYAALGATTRAEALVAAARRGLRFD